MLISLPPRSQRVTPSYLINPSSHNPETRPIAESFQIPHLVFSGSPKKKKKKKKTQSFLALRWPSRGVCLLGFFSCGQTLLGLNNPRGRVPNEAVRLEPGLDVSAASELSHDYGGGLAGLFSLGESAGKRGADSDGVFAE